MPRAGAGYECRIARLLFMDEHLRLADLPERTQDYLKVLWDIAEHTGGDAVPLGELARRTGQKLPTASEAVKRLAAQRLVYHERYSGVQLTEEGRRLAMGMVRRHRLLETFLVTTLGYTWDEVHEDADRLEHACSDLFVERLDALLGSPARDPHGDPIPDPEGRIEDLGTATLADAPVGATVAIERVRDEDAELLRYLQEHGVRVGESVTVEAVVAGLVQVRVGDTVMPLALDAAREITVSGM